MNNTFKSVISSKFLKMIEDGLVGREVPRETGLKVYEILKHVELNVPSSPDFQWSINWTPSSINVFPEQVDFLLILLKYAWLYSGHKENNEELNIGVPEVYSPASAIPNGGDLKMQFKKR